MRSYLISYDLSGPSRDYSPLFKAIKADSKWWHYLESVWIVQSDRDADQLFESLQPHLGPKDRILIAPLRAEDHLQGWLPEKAWAWLEKNLT